MLSLLSSKLAGYALGALALFGVGCFAGYRFELPGVQAAKLALAAQQTADAQATAMLDAQVADERVRLANASDAAQAARQALRQARVARGGDIRAAVAAQAGQAGQDAPVAPVLAAALAAMKSDQVVTP